MVSRFFKFSLVIFSLFIFSDTCAQEKKEFHYYRLVNTTGTISPGFRTSDGATTMSLHGFFEFFLQDKVSWRGDAFYYMGEQKKPLSIANNSTLKWGAFYHFHKPTSKLDLYLGFQPGLNFVQPVTQRIDGSDQYHTLKAVPVISGVSGVNFHFGKVFNMFLEGTNLEFQGDWDFTL
jgi:hypothetical protein